MGLKGEVWVKWLGSGERPLSFPLGSAVKARSRDHVAPNSVSVLR